MQKIDRWQLAILLIPELPSDLILAKLLNPENRFLKVDRDHLFSFNFVRDDSSYPLYGQSRELTGLKHWLKHYHEGIWLGPCQFYKETYDACYLLKLIAIAGLDFNMSRSTLGELLRQSLQRSIVTFIAEITQKIHLESPHRIECLTPRKKTKTDGHGRTDYEAYLEVLRYIRVNGGSSSVTEEAARAACNVHSSTFNKFKNPKNPAHEFTKEFLHVLLEMEFS